MPTKPLYFAFVSLPFTATRTEFFVLHFRRKADLNHRDDVGRHSLHLAAQADSIASIDFLVVECGVDVNGRATNSDDTALHVAAKVNNSRLLQLRLVFHTSMFVFDFHFHSATVADQTRSLRYRHRSSS